MPSSSDKVHQSGEQKVRASLHWVSLLVAVAGLALVIAVGRSRGVGESAYATGHSVGYSVGQWVGALLLAAIVGMIAFWCSKRSTKVLNAAFIAVFVAVLLNSLWIQGGPRSRRSAAALKELQAELGPAKERISQAMDNNDADAAQAEVTAIAARLSKASESMSGGDAIVTRVAAEAVDHLLKMADGHNRAMTAFSESGGVSPDGLTVASADQRLKLLAELARQHKHFCGLLGEFPGWVEGRMVAHGLSESKAQSNSRSFLKGAKYTSIVRMHEQTAILIEQFQLIIQHLRSTNGRWHIDVQDDTLVFEVDSEAERYNQLIETMTAAAERESQLQQAIRSK